MEEFWVTYIDWKSFFFWDFWKVHSLWKLLMWANWYFCKKHFFNLFQNSIMFPKIYSFMGLTWMCLEVLTEIYDVVQIIWRTSKLWFFNFLDIFLAFVKIFSQFFFNFLGRQMVAFLSENKAIWKSFQQLRSIESLFSFRIFEKFIHFQNSSCQQIYIYPKTIFFNLFQNSIMFPKIYSCLSLECVLNYWLKYMT